MSLDPKNLKPGEDQYEYFERNKKEYVQYDYRHYNGDLFSCVASGLDQAYRERDKWVSENESTKDTFEVKTHIPILPYEEDEQDFEQ